MGFYKVHNKKNKLTFTISGMNKRMPLFIFLLISTFLTVGQSLSILKYDSLVTGDALESNAIYAHAAIKNNTSNPIDVQVKRIVEDENSLTDDNAICWGICYAPEVSTSLMAISIEAGGIDSLNFTGHVYPDKDGIPESGNITYIFFNESDTMESVSISVHYSVVLTSIHQQFNEELNLRIYPNPATNNIYLEVPETFPGHVILKLYNYSGELIISRTISETDRSKKINIRNLPGGNYIYTLEQEAYILGVGKLLLQTSRQ